MSEADLAYEAAVSEITQGKAEGKTRLQLISKTFAALDRLPLELEDYTDLQDFALDGTQISDLSLLQALTGLQTLWLSGRQIKDIASVQALTNIQTISLIDTQVSDLSPLKHLEGLNRLWLKRSRLVSDLTPLQDLTNLQTISLRETDVSDLTPLRGLKHLRRLSLDETMVTDLTPLQALKNLERLDLNVTQVSDLSALRGLTNLDKLSLNSTLVSDLRPLQALKSLRRLDLNATHVKDLTPLRALTDLQSLALFKTLVSDLTPLQALKGLRLLTLRATGVSDLRPIAKLEQLKAGGLNTGLFFRDTPATMCDAELARLAEIEDNQDRTVKTLDYLLRLPRWPEPYTPEATPDGSPPRPIGQTPPAPEQDQALPLVWGEHGFGFFAESMNGDPVTEAVLHDLRALLNDLRRKGNQHDDLYQIAGELQDRSAGDISELRMISLHISYQKLRRLYRGRVTRQVQFDDETIFSMEAVLDLIPGVTLVDNNVRVLIERQTAENAAGLLPAQGEVANRLLQAVQEPDAPFAPEVKGAAAEVLKPEFNDQLTGTRGILSRNIVVSALKWTATTIAAGAISGPVGSFVYNNGNDLLSYAATIGDDGFLWAQSVLAKFRVEYEIAMGVTRELALGRARQNQSSGAADDHLEK